MNSTDPGVEIDIAQYGVRVKGRGVVTTFNDNIIIGRANAEHVAEKIREVLGEECSVERVLFYKPEESNA